MGNSQKMRYNFFRGDDSITLQDVMYIVLGSLLQAIGYSVFVAPSNIVPGGVYGITIALNHLTRGLFAFAPEGLPIGVTALLFNIPLLILATKKLGFGSGPKTILTFLLISIFTDTLGVLLEGKQLVPDDKILASFYGGAIIGVGVYFIFKAGSTSAGTDVLGRVFAKGKNFKLSNAIILVDSMVVLFGLLVYRDLSVPLYSWLTIFVYGQVVSILQPENPKKAVFIVSPRLDELKELLIDKLKLRGTYIHGQGMYRGEEREVIFTIVERKSLPKVKNGVWDIDPTAFISTMDASNDVSLMKNLK